jgi:VanZ family protein
VRDFARASSRGNTSTDSLRLDWLRYWVSIVGWGAIIWTLSTRSFSENATAQRIVPLLHWLLPIVSHRNLLWLHHLIRKGAHVTEYFVFSLLLLSGVRRGRPGWRLSWALVALALAACWATSDELHQIFVPNRGPSPFDVLLDILGAAAAQVPEAWKYRSELLTRLRDRNTALASSA